MNRLQCVNIGEVEFASASVSYDVYALGPGADSGLLARTGASAGLLGQINDTRTGNAAQAVTGAGLASQADQQALSGQQALAGLQQANNAQRIA